MEKEVKELIATGVGLLGIFFFIVALTVLPWGVVYA